MAAPDLAGNLMRVRERIAAACTRAHRGEDEVTLVAVTKTASPEQLIAACRAGLCDLGENRIQDALRRQQELPSLLAAAGLAPQPLRWHFIGHLQRNKAKQAVGSFVLLHAVDSWPLCDRLATLAAAAGHRQPILIEVNLTREPQKHGSPPEATCELVARAATCAHLDVQGLMTMARFGAPPAETHATFAGLRRLAEAARAECRVELPHLSMGMSDDFEAAVEEGATLVRIGTALFGPRSG